VTCDGTETCGTTCVPQWLTCDARVTCQGYGAQTCDLGDPLCCHDVERTSWGKIKKQFK
jgi:hypothetical protein